MALILISTFTLDTPSVRGKKRERETSRRIASNGHDGVILRSREIGEREREGGSKERGNEERTDDGMDQGEEGSEKGPLVGGENVTEVGVVSTAPHCRALSPLLALPPPPSSLERALYF